MQYHREHINIVVFKGSSGKERFKITFFNNKIVHRDIIIMPHSGVNIKTRFAHEREPHGNCHGSIFGFSWDYKQDCFSSLLHHLPVLPLSSENIQTRFAGERAPHEKKSVCRRFRQGGMEKEIPK